jgi:hypothetical protein
MRHIIGAWLLALAFMAGSALAQPEKGWGHGEKDEGMGGGGWGEHHEMQHPPQPLTTDQINEFMAFVKEVDPGRIAKLEKLHQERPELYEKVLQMGFWKMKQLKEVKNREPKLYDQKVQMFVLQGKVYDLAKSFKDATNDGDKKKIKAELDGDLNKLFDLRQADREQDIARLKDRVTKLETALQKRKENKDKIIKDHADKLLGSQEDMEW